MGKINVTTSPELAIPVVILAGSSYLFYITVANYTLGTYLYLFKNLNLGGVGSMMASDEYMEVLQVYALAYPLLLTVATGDRMVRSTALNVIVLSMESLNSQYCHLFILQRQCVLLY